MKKAIKWMMKSVAFVVLVSAALLPLLMIISGVVYIVLHVIFSVISGERTPDLFWTLVFILYGVALLGALVFGAVKGVNALSNELQRMRSLRTCRKAGHDWAGYVCRRCGAGKPHAHEWNGCQCIWCGRIRNEGHQWEELRCEHCGGTGFVKRETGGTLSYGDLGYGDPDYEEPCGCDRPVTYRCSVCGMMMD